MNRVIVGLLISWVLVCSWLSFLYWTSALAIILVCKLAALKLKEPRKLKMAVAVITALVTANIVLGYQDYLRREYPEDAPEVLQDSRYAAVRQCIRNCRDLDIAPHDVFARMAMYQCERKSRQSHNIGSSRYNPL
jgi:hypothetical protein